MVSGVPQRLALGMILFNILVNDMDSGIECTLSKFTDDIKLCGADDMLKRTDAIHRDLDRLERCNQDDYNYQKLQQKTELDMNDIFLLSTILGY
ncbi:hypothetical protein WISP_133223 [Willisornis vidua]|uniref:Reverse transcriptase domain-containing protein n=1 Tax=Willisornis vidua TaxID=1566151 RepID=A0ABQ9CP22_9PASS|nr:hypothetical protein WISP_133223 [Willisornis vidua]